MVRGTLLLLLVAVAGNARAEHLLGAEAQSWAGAALPGGALVRVRVADGGMAGIVEHVCGAAVAAVPRAGVGDTALPGSEVLALVLPDGGDGRLYVPDLAWSRWALELSAAYRAVVCARLQGVLDDDALRAAWLDLLRHIDQRTRDEASRLAADRAVWAASLREAELVALVAALSLFPVRDAERDRWLTFLLDVPPGPLQLALLRAAEGTSRAFFVDFVARFNTVWRNQPTFRAQCAALHLAERPDACPPLPENAAAIPAQHNAPATTPPQGDIYADP